MTGVMPGLKKNLLYIVFIGNYATICGIVVPNDQAQNCLLAGNEFKQEGFP